MDCRSLEIATFFHVGFIVLRSDYKISAGLLLDYYYYYYYYYHYCYRN